MNIVVAIDNIYRDGYREERIYTLDTAPLPERDDEDAWESWWDEHVWPLTGTDTGRNNVDAGYFVEIIAADDPKVVGIEMEWC